MHGGKYFTDELLNLFSIMAQILPIGPIEWDKVTERHSVKFPGRDTDSLRRKYTSTHRRKVPTGDPNCPPEVREAKRLKMAIGSKAELADCATEFDMEAESSDDDVSLESGITSATGTERSRGGLRVRTPAPKKADLMSVLVMQMTTDAQERQKERVEAAKERLAQATEAAKDRAAIAEEKAADRTAFATMVAGIAKGYFDSKRKYRPHKKKRKQRAVFTESSSGSDSSSDADSVDSGTKPKSVV